MFVFFIKRSMNKVIVRLVAVVLLLFTFLPLAAQKAQSDITATLIDDASGEPVGFATVSVSQKNSTTPYKYALTNEKGFATLPGVRNGTYIFKAELMGLIPYEKEIVVKDKDIALGEIRMKTDTKLLDAASVSALGNPVVIKKDTIEYNATSFKTTENDVLEDLLKKLPGVEVDSDGTITANGKTIEKIYIDGKTYFMDDPALASKNLPAKIIDKVKVVKKKSDQAEFTGIDDGQEETVIDLSVQKGMMNGLMGNIRAGLGHDVPVKESSDSKFEPYNDTRFTSNLFLGNFSEGKQFSVIGNANNGNRLGFGDFAGNMMRGMGGGMRSGNGGVTTSYLLGGHAGFDLLDDRMELVSDLAYSGTRTDSDQESYKETYYDDYNQISNTKNVSLSTSDGYRFGMRLEHEFSENNSIIFEPQINYGMGTYNTTEEFDTKTDDRNGNVTRTNDGFSFNGGDNRNLQASGRLMYRQRLGIPGRTLVLFTNFRFSNNETDGLTQSLTNTYIDDVQKDSIINQHTDQYSRSTNISGRAVFTEPLGNDFYAEANYAYNWSRSNSEKTAYDIALFDDNFSEDTRKDYIDGARTKNTAYSNSITNLNIRQEIGANLMFRREKILAQIGVSLNPTKVSNYTERAAYTIDTTYSVLNWSPQAMFFYEPNDYTEARFRYRGNTSQPSVTQLVPVLDNSNPINQSLGNPYLLPYFSHDFGGEFQYGNPKEYTTLSVRLNGGFVKNPIVNSTWTNREDGMTFTMPVNGPASSNFNFFMFGNMPIYKQNVLISNMTRFSYSNSSSYVGNNIETDKYYYDDDFDYVAFRRDYSDIDASDDFQRNDTRSLSVTERLHLTYRNDALEIRAGGSVRYSNTNYTIYSEQNINTWRNTVDGSFIWNWDLPGMTFRTDVNYRWYRGYTTDMPSEAIVNAEISKLVFHRKATVALNVYDLLGQTRSLNVSDTANYHSESLSNTVGRYVMLSFTWRFGTFGKGGDRRGPGMRGPGMRGPGMGGPGMRGPGGPPRF